MSTSTATSPLASPKGSHGAGASAGELASRLAAAEELCKSLREENEQLKEEMEYVRLEIDEVRDRVRDEEGREFGELQKELDLAAKNCRILQFKLRKAERRIEVAEGEKLRLEEQMRMQHRRDAKDENGYLRELEEELRVAKEVSVRLHDELELAEERRAKFEMDNEKLRNLLRQADQERIGLEKETEGLRRQIERMQGEMGISSSDATTQSLPQEVAAMMNPLAGQTTRTLVRSATSESTSRHSPLHTQMRQGSFDSEWSELKRDLCDSLEREQDLREQLKYAEEQIKSLRKKLNDFEEENESLIMQVKRLMNRNKQQQQQSSSGNEDVQQLHLDLSEQEVRILKRKLEAAERQNDTFSQQVKELQGKLSMLNSQHSLSSHGDDSERKHASPLLGRGSMEKQLSSDYNDDSNLRDKLADLNREAEDLRMLLKEKENELQALMELPSNASSDVKQSHMKKQLDLLRQETLLLRDKITKQESEKQQLLQQNQRMALQIASSGDADSKTSSGGRLDALEADNQSLKTKLKSLEEDRKKEQFLAAERLTLFDKELGDTHSRLSFLQAENEQLLKKLAAVETSKADQKSVSVGKQAEEDQQRYKTLQDKILTLQKEIDDLLAIIQSKDQNEQRLQNAVASLEVELDRRSGEFARRESDMLSSIATLKRNNTVLSSLLDLMTERAEITQATLDKYLQTLATPPDLIAASMGEGLAQVQHDTGTETASKSTDDIQMKVKIISLEKKLSQAETQLADFEGVKNELEYRLAESDRKIVILEKSELDRNLREETLMQEIMSVSSSKQQQAAQSLAAENKKLVENRQKLETQISQCNEHIKFSEQMIKQLKEQIESEKQQHQEMVDALQTNLKDLEDKNSELTGKVADVTKQLNKEKADVKTLKEQHESSVISLKEELATKSEQLKKLEKDTANITKELQKKENDLADREKQLKQKDQFVFKRDDAIKAHEEAIRQLKIDKTKLEDEIKANNSEAKK